VRQILMLPTRGNDLWQPIQWRQMLRILGDDVEAALLEVMRTGSMVIEKS
jgi:hypothetical protein